MKHTGEIVDIESPADFPEPQKIEEILEPMINATIILPKQYLGILSNYAKKNVVNKKR